ncbi:MAG: hypothetical protein JSR15_04765 [Proteobacteria bacterium]|nr:hypothetical protein [Pseudomonadota bacterium]
MRSYVAVSGSIFALIVVAHVWRAAVEGPGMFEQPSFIMLTAAAGGMAVWAWRVYRKLPKG